MLHWPGPDTPLYEFREGKHRQIEVLAGMNEVKRRDVLRTAMLRCPNPSGDMVEHYLPLSYASYGEPLVVGLVGSTQSGKSHLLAAMIDGIQGGGLQPYGLKVDAVDIGLHQSYLNERVTPLFRDAQRIGGTREGIVTYADALLVTSPTGEKVPVAFFDVAGGDLLQTGQTARFIAGAGALIFVVDPVTALLQPGDPAGHQVGRSDGAFDTVLTRLGVGQRFLEIPAAIVINKSDRLRFQPPADRWLRAASTGGRVDADRLLAESRDAYAMLYEHGAYAWLRPFHECRRCTLHFVSATGGECDGETYPRGVRPRRVLEPLLALLAMRGLIPGPESMKVGVW
jgi:hypothetical protein